MNKEAISAKREMQLNEFASQKSNDYNSILYYLITIMVITSIIFILKKMFPIIPNFVFELTLTIVITVYMFKIYFKFLDISRRDAIYYDEVAAPDPKNINLSTDQILSTNALNNSSGNGQSIFCDPNSTHWDSDNNYCVAGVITDTPR